MNFKSVENDGGLMAEGDYEVILLKADESVTKNGNPCIALDFQVRVDVDQKYQRKHIFKNFWPDESGNYDGVKIGKFANALGIDKDTEFELSDLVGKCCIVHMSHYQRQDGSGESECIRYCKPTAAGQLVKTDGFTEITDEELPF